MSTTTTNKSAALFQRAQAHIPGGVNSPVRAFRAVGGQPRFMASANGATITDVDGKQYIDYIGSWGPMVLGHNRQEIRAAVLKAVEHGLSFGAATEAEVQMAELLTSMVPSLQMVRMVNSGTEAVMSALRVARGFTGRDKIIKFEGCYHGHCDSMLVRAGSGAMTAGVPDSAGVPAGCAKDTLTAQYNNMASVQQLFAENSGQIAAVIIEPVAANMGVVLPKEGFLQALSNLCKQQGALLIFDEVITGFRLGVAGAQGHYGITPDLTTFGKIIGAGMPVGAYGGRADIMGCVAPLGPVYQAGTLSGNPVAMAAGIAQLSILKNNPQIYTQIAKNAALLCDGFRDILKRAGQGYQVTNIGSLGCLFFTNTLVQDYQTAKTADTAAYATYFTAMLEAGIYLAPAQFEAMFVSAAHTGLEIDQTLSAAQAYFLK